MKLSKINNILMYILIWFMIYSSALLYTHLPKWFGYFKDVIIFYFAIILISKRKIKKVKDIGVSFYVLFLLVSVISWMGMTNGTAGSTIEIVIRIFRYLEFFILFFVFANLEEICTVPYKKLINWYINLSLILIFVNIFGYFVPNDIVSIYIRDTTAYRNRISVGQPAVVAYPMIISFLFLLVYTKSNMKNILKMLMLLVGIIISVSTTGILSIIVCILVFLFMHIDKKKLKKITPILCSLCIIFAIGLAMISNVPKLNKVYEQASLLLTTKVKALFNDRITDLAMKARDDYYKEVKDNTTNIIQRLFGLGLLGFYTDENMPNSLENTYRSMRLCYGIIGLIAYILFLSKHTLGELKNIKTKQGMFIVLMFIAFAMHSYTLEVLYLPTIAYTLSLFYCYVKRKEVNDEITDNQ